MSVTRVAGHPDYTSATGGSGFIPEVWSGKLLVKFYDGTCLTEITNNDYEGEIKGMGDTVHIRQTPDTTIRDYEVGQKLTVERPESTMVDLLIDKGKYYNFVIDDVIKAQSDIKLMDNWTTDASNQLKISIETSIFADVYDDVSAYNTGATAGKVSGDINLGATDGPVQLSSTNIIDYIVDAGLTLDEQNVGETGRWMVLPAWACALIKKSDLKDASLTGDSVSPLRNGKIGTVDTFTIYKSNILSTVAAATDASGFKCYRALFGTNDAITFASQFTNTETLRAESTFGDIVRGLKVYGYKVAKSEALGLLYCCK